MRGRSARGKVLQFFASNWPIPGERERDLITPGDLSEGVTGEWRVRIKNAYGEGENRE